MKATYENILKISKEAPSGNKIVEACLEVALMLVEKNKSYGDSALNPIRIFSKADNVEQIKVRIDDKLNRVNNSQGYPGDNDIDDLIGYLILYKIAKSS
jgi:hypothetical protein